MHEPVQSTWRVINLGDAVTLSRGKDLPVHSRSQGQYPVVGSNGVVGYHSAYAAKSPGVLVGRSGSVGEVAWVEQDYWPLNTTLWVTDFHGNDPRFISFFLRYLDLGRFTGGVSVPTLNRNVLHRIEVRIPPVAEQRSISNVLQTVQKAKEERQRELALERERKAALMDYLFAQGTRGNERRSTEIGEIRKDWMVLPLTEVATIERGKFAHRPRNAPEFYGGTIPFIQTGDVTASNGHITKHSQTLNEKGLSVSRVFPKGTIVITIAANIGFTAILDFDSAFPDSLIGITPNECVDADFLNYYIY
jgi:type I restriction enzyme S subunit